MGEGEITPLLLAPTPSHLLNSGKAGLRVMRVETLILLLTGCSIGKRGPCISARKS